MWCTRWFLPLLLLPLPTAPPYFLLLFLFSLTLHAKPCFYCIVLLTTLFLSSCYWQPFPLSSPLTIPWSENITTFAAALNATILPNISRPLPTVIRAVDHCWCDLSAASFFDPFNVSHWEYVSVKRLSQELEHPIPFHDFSPNNATKQLASPSPSPPAMPWLWRRLPPLSSLLLPLTGANIFIPDISANSQDHTSSTHPPSQPRYNFLNSFEFDLQPYGFGLIIDLGWSR